MFLEINERFLYKYFSSVDEDLHKKLIVGLYRGIWYTFFICFLLFFT